MRTPVDLQRHQITPETALSDLTQIAADLISRGCELLGRRNTVFMVILADRGDVHLSTDVDVARIAEFAQWATAEVKPADVRSMPPGTTTH